MGYEHKEGSASLFKNDKKGNQNAPDWRGDGLLNGKKVKIAAWEKHGNKGLFFSLKIEEDNFKPSVKNTERKIDAKQVSAPLDDMSDSIPFMRLMPNQIVSW